MNNHNYQQFQHPHPGLNSNSAPGILNTPSQMEWHQNFFTNTRYGNKLPTAPNPIQIPFPTIAHQFNGEDGHVQPLGFDLQQHQPLQQHPEPSQPSTSGSTNFTNINSNAVDPVAVTGINDSDSNHSKSNLESVSSSDQTRRGRGRPKKQDVSVPVASNSSNGPTNKHIYSCTLCTKSFTAPGSLRRHQSIRHSENPQKFVCNLCDKRYTEASTLATHKLEFHERKRVYHQCASCNLKFRRKFLLDDHLLLYNDTCGNSNSAEGTHQDKVQSGRVLLEFSRIQDIKKQNPNLIVYGKKNSARTICTVCNRMFSDAGSLRRHKLIHSGEPTLSCPHCPRKFRRSREYDLNIHVAAHANIETATATVPELAEPKPGIFECSDCKRPYRSAIARQTHKCTKTPERKFACSYCDKRFYEAYELEYHQNYHLNTGRHKSKYCERRFSKWAKWKVHERWHAEKGICFDKDRMTKKCILCQEKLMTRFLYQKHVMETHGRTLSIPIKRLEITPFAPMSDKDNSASTIVDTKTRYVLCNTCGNCSNASDYRQHRELCEQNKSTWETMTPGNNPDDFDEHSFDQPQLKCTTVTDDIPNSPTGSLTDVINESAANFLDNADHDEIPEWYDDCNAIGGLLEETDDVEPDVDQQPEVLKPNLERRNTLFFAEHMRQKLCTPMSILVNKMLFKPLMGKYRTVSLVKPCDDTFNIPWYLCTRCGRSTTYRCQTNDHVRYNCPKKDIYSAIRLKDVKLVNPTTRVGRLFDAEYTVPIAVSDKASGAAAWRESWSDLLLPKNARNPDLDLRIEILEDGKYQCTICEKIFPENNAKAARSHIRVHNEKKWVCETCGARLGYKHSYDAHMRIHTGERPYPCRICDKRFPCSTSRFMHERDKHKRSTGRFCRTPDGKFLCRICNKSYGSYCGFNDHMKDVHPNERISKVNNKTESGKRILSCDQCSKTFATNSQRVYHRRFVHPRNGPPKTYLCDHCPKILKCRKSLMRHLVVFHPKNGTTGQKFFHCAICGKGFSLVASIRQHLRSHHAGLLPQQLLTENVAIAEDGITTYNIANFFVHKTTKTLLVEQGMMI